MIDAALDVVFGCNLRLERGVGFFHCLLPAVIHVEEPSGSGNYQKYTENRTDENKAAFTPFGRFDGPVFPVAVILDVALGFLLFHAEVHRLLYQDFVILAADLAVEPGYVDVRVELGKP